MKLQAHGVTVRHGARTVLDGIDFALQPGELVLLAGRNGAGKSTLLRVLLGAQRCDGGELQLGERPLGEWHAKERARQLAFVPQEADSPFEFTGRELVAMGRSPYLSRWQALRPADVTAIDAALTAVDAVAFADRPVTTLSGGELRRIGVARALATEAPLLLLDEPTSNLDLEHALRLCALLQKLAEQGRGLAVASHDLNLLGPFAHRVVVLHEGRVFADGAPEQALSDSAMATVFGVASAAPTGFFPRAFRVPDDG